MLIGGFIKQTFIDWPGNICSMIFTQGCNYRCIYCHNSSLLSGADNIVDEIEVFDYLIKNKDLLDALVISGGEPTLHKDLPDFIRKIKSLGFKVKLDTNGTNPDMLKDLINEDLVDYIAMDIKSELTFSSYYVISDKLPLNNMNKVQESIDVILDSGIEYQFRTTVIKGVHTSEIINSIKNRVGDNLKIQNLRSDTTLSNELTEKDEFSESEFELLGAAKTV